MAREWDLTVLIDYDDGVPTGKVTELLESGWEPFAATDVQTINGPRQKIFFRKRLLPPENSSEG